MYEDTIFLIFSYYLKKLLCLFRLPRAVIMETPSKRNTKLRTVILLHLQANVEKWAWVNRRRFISICESHKH